MASRKLLHEVARALFLVEVGIVEGSPPYVTHKHPHAIITAQAQLMADATRTIDAKKLLGESVEESRAKRLEKQQSRYRDRGGYVNISHAFSTY